MKKLILILIFKDHLSGIILAGGVEYIRDVYLSITDDEEAYPYPLENIEITEFQNVLGRDGVKICYFMGIK